ncbi:hypothetical protein ACFXPW_23675 [Streptomyces goshikiensis]|uniref:hypothetical protein n=1 Tax=Streptomyces goshikiensis TaxID=1942 RepID=UPI00368340FB
MTRDQRRRRSTAPAALGLTAVTHNANPDPDPTGATRDGLRPAQEGAGAWLGFSRPAAFPGAREPESPGARARLRVTAG